MLRTPFRPSLRLPPLQDCKSSRRGRPTTVQVRADKDHVFTRQAREAASLKAGIAKSRAERAPVDAATRRRYRSAVGKRDLLCAESHTHLLEMVPQVTRETAIGAVRKLRGCSSPPELTSCPSALLGSWELIRPTAPASLGMRSLEDLSLGGITWSISAVHVTGVSRYFAVNGEFCETYRLRGTTDVIERFGTFWATGKNKVELHLAGVTLVKSTTYITVDPTVNRATLDICYLDHDFCLVGHPREHAATVQAWVQDDPLPLAW